ncbi:MAG TPA: S9 family peptidase [Candidatus Rubrimentiphilum sp.]|nr:S9 family peptidase [Candidatus Rubrimentiphilum sp.]
MRFAIIAAVSIAAFLPAAGSARMIDFGDLRNLTSLSSPQISPDGKRIIFFRSRPDYTKDRSQSDLMLIDVKTKKVRQLTFNRRGLSSPRWSPDGSSIAFLMSTTVEGVSDPQEEIFVLPMNGGDPRPVTKAEQGVDGFAWSPNGRQFAFITQDANPYKKQIDAHLDAFEVGANDYLHTEAAIPSHLWVISSAGGDARRLTSGPWSLGTVDPGSTSGLSWSPDSTKIAFDHFPTAVNGDTLGTVIDVIDVRTGKFTPLTGNKGLEGGGTFAPVGSAISYSRNTGGDPTNGNAVYVTRLGGGPGKDIRKQIDRTINGTAWDPSGKAMWLFGPDRSQVAAWYVTLGGSTKTVNLGNVAISQTGQVARKTGALAFVGTTTSHPAELYYLASPSSKPVRLTNYNGFISKIQLGQVTAVNWKNDGFSENGVLTLPPGYNAQKSYPLVLVIHGGPQSASTLAWNSQNQLFAAHGYLVFNPNYRGSTNWGDAFEHAIYHDAGAGPGRDVMAGIAAVEKAYNVDKSKIAVSGWSYGGYMTSWMTGHYNIWKTAVAGAALNDWFDDYNVAFYVYTDVPWFGGSPWNPKYSAMWRDQSPITYAQSIKTPTLILGDIGDNNVTITNSFKMYHALKDNGVPVQFVAYPVHGHFPGDPVRSEDVTRRWLAWIDRYLRT